MLEKDPIFRPRARNVLKMLLIRNNRAEVLELRDQSLQIEKESLKKLENMRKGASMFRSEDDSLVLKTINVIIKQDEKLAVRKRTHLLRSSQKKDIFDLAAVIQEVCSVSPGFSIWK